MNLLQQLNEQADEHQEAAALVKAVREAKPFFDKRGSSTALLYRGVSGSSFDVTYTKPRPDRVPTDTHPIIHRRLDAMMKKDFGHPYRTHSLFTTPSPNFARFYGDVKIVLPVGDFSFLYSQSVRDAYTYFDPIRLFRTIKDAHSPELQEVLYDYHLVFNGTTVAGDTSGKSFLEAIMQTEEGKELFERWIVDQYEQANFSDRQLHLALAQDHEIMLNCERAALIDPRPLNKWARKVLEQEFDLGDLSDKDMQKADLINLLSTVV